MPTPNITAILAGLAGGLLLLIATAVGSYGFGKHVARGEQAQQEVVVANAYLEAGRRNAEAESAASLEQQKKLDAQRRAAAEKRHTLEKELLNDEIRKCRVSDATYGLLRDAVWRANHPPVTGGVNGASAPAADPAKPER